MADFQTPNLPSRDFDRTLAFMTPLGFEPGYRSDGWMILTRGSLQVEYFAYPDLPAEHGYGCCLRLDDLDSFYETCFAAGIPVCTTGTPRLHPAIEESWGRRAAMIDPDGVLFHLIQN
jgi:catechol 2,3-dioxygenase-like lactoylglutathione lyase family enzyme